MLDAGEDVVVVLRESGTGKGNGAPMDQRIGVVFTVRDELTIPRRSTASRRTRFGPRA